MGGYAIRFSEALFEEICTLIAEGQNLTQICRNPEMPNRTKFMSWVNKNPELMEKFEQAKRQYVDVMHDLMDEVEAQTLDGTYPPAAANVVLNNRRWRLENLNSKVFGQKKSVALTGAGGGPLERIDKIELVAASNGENDD